MYSDKNKKKSKLSKLKKYSLHGIYCFFALSLFQCLPLAQAQETPFFTNRVERASMALCNNTPNPASGGTWSACGSLIVIDSIEKLNNMRFQLDGRGYRTSPDATVDTSACPSDGCKGYILWRSLNFTENASYTNPNAPFDQSTYVVGTGAGTVKSILNDTPRTNMGPPSSDAWRPSGWRPVGSETTPFTATFDGNGYVITGLRLLSGRPNGSPRSNVARGYGLFGYTSSTALIQDLGLNGDCAIVTHAIENNLGGLVGYNNGTITNSYATCHVYSYIGRNLGGLVGLNGPQGVINNTYATGSVTTVRNILDRDVLGGMNIGGLVGWNRGSINNSFATGLAPPLTGAGDVFGRALQRDSPDFGTGTGTPSSIPMRSCGGSDYKTCLPYSSPAGSVHLMLTYLGLRFVGGFAGVNDGTITNSYWNNGMISINPTVRIPASLAARGFANAGTDREIRLRSPGQALCCRKVPNSGGTGDYTIWQESAAYASSNNALFHTRDNVSYVTGPLAIGTGCVRQDCGTGVANDPRYTFGQVSGVNNFDTGLTAAEFGTVNSTSALGDAFQRTAGSFPKVYVLGSNTTLVGGQ